jgi:hypothetical protein
MACPRNLDFVRGRTGFAGTPLDWRRSSKLELELNEYTSCKATD